MANVQSQMIHKQVFYETANAPWHVTDNSWRGMRWQMLSHRWFTNRYHSRRQQMFYDSHRQFTDRYEKAGHLHKIHRQVHNSKHLATITGDSQTGMMFSITWQMFSMSHSRVVFSVMCSWAWCSLSSENVLSHLIHRRAHTISTDEYDMANAQPCSQLIHRLTMLTADSQTNNLTSMWGRSHSQSQIIAKLTVSFSFSPCAASSTVRLTIPVWPLHTSLLTVMVTSNITCQQQKYHNDGGDGDDDDDDDDDNDDNGGDDNDGFKKDPFQAPHLQIGQS